MNEKILVVDDDKAIARLIGQIAEMGGYACCLAHNGDDAREHLRKDTFHLVLCDVNMPGESGVDLARHIIAEYPDTAVVMVSAMDDAEIANTALDMGTYGYIIKPFKPNELAINIANAIRRRELEIESRQHSENLEKMVQERTEALQHSLSDLRKSLEGTIQAMAMTVESRDPYTAGHQRRVADLAVAIVGEMGINSDRVEGIRMAGVIHDLGKISVPSEILSKPGKINEYEFELIKNHAQVGYDILKEINFPWPIAQIVYQHHERMNGSGYPKGITGDDILMEARIIGVADVVEAMASHRPYRPALGIEVALEEISKNRGLFYDSDVADSCLRLFKEKGFELTSR